MEYRVKTGDIIDVTITGIQPYGAFASLPDHTSGLIHISEISDKFVRSVESFVHVGEVIRVKVIDIDEESHQAKLSLKAVHTAKRKYKRAYKNQREKIQETPLGFNPLKEKLPEWIAQGIKKEEE
ncbi:CvfD/Ygs/GSP13 family RNA-binding post-transcriptional regulator [Longibaculum muris]|jgi:general stress protein 13|uniref:General stress protein 13 n=1 Tax=Longibaculum muris TaxID=1796628 RepID=A0A4R3YWP8_9FIRM|nr:CvfD/Ygs/GSP13 family RNA-binding post-transcriptional regulator [Longibaculum muris]KXU47959.1 general stress protein 13 [Candidatus Stoquefichus sp. KLE1796]MBS5368506.1 S1 RNA-binding domain-containing protein [Coprobacillus cateniformis]MCR1888717.1 CvfD/Ygs/GSP13 family RNA-binding post-transcriptional regulator [Longibaculum muris]MED9812221.1 CvfD/Ygs/GSP13 family RNA-binding post-transcriptional regulator [Longibaculum muris]TCV96942.1 general stress protein 13 [Longibaculum muris]